MALKSGVLDSSDLAAIYPLKLGFTSVILMGVVELKTPRFLDP